MTADPVLVLDDDVTPVVVVQNDLIRYLFTDDDTRNRCSDSAPGQDVAS